MECQICKKQAPPVTVSTDNPIMQVISLSAAMQELGWLMDGNLIYCPSHHPKPPEDMLEQLAAARGNMLATSRRKNNET